MGNLFLKQTGEESAFPFRAGCSDQSAEQSRERQAEGALRRYFPAMKSATVTRSLVLREAAATFSCGPEAEKLRFGPQTPVRGLFVAGDWTPTGLPATIEGAVRSGFAAAAEVEKG